MPYQHAEQCLDGKSCRPHWAKRMFPEGTYGLRTGTFSSHAKRTRDEYAMNELEVLRVVKLIERVYGAFDRAMPDRDDRPFWNTVTHLVRSEYVKKAVTITSLCSVTGLPYATSRRFIRSLISQGLIVRSVRGKSEKTHSLHPSDGMMRAFETYAREMKSVFAEAIGARCPGESEDEYYFGEARASQFVPPSKLTSAASNRGELQFLVNDDPYFAALRNVWTDFRSNLGSTSSFHLHQCAEMRRELIENSKRAVSRYDIVSVNLSWLGELAESNVIQPIADLLDQSGYASSVADADIKSLGQWNGKNYGVPIYCSVNTFAARSDLFEEAGLKYPKTFDEVIAAGRKLAGPGRYGIVWDAGPGTPVAQSFMALMAAAGGSPLLARGPRTGLLRKRLQEEELADVIVSDAGHRTLGYMHRLIEISPPTILKSAWDDSLDVFMSGQAAMGYIWSMRATRLEYDIRSLIKARVKYLLQPVAFGGTRASPLSGFLLAIPTNLPKERARLAIEAVGWLISAKSDQQREHGLPMAPRFATDSEMKASSRVLSFIHDLAQKGLLHTQHRPATPRFPQIEAILGEEVHAALRREKDDVSALNSAALRISRLTEKPRTLLDVPNGPFLSVRDHASVRQGAGSAR
ncbi:extracellular solute-binding protein [Mesorhizobium sp. M00.F.Ca.ET.170.01.1.1]|nr:extracellular solute-binding protein [Mesorhizobium sp. M00.F.Ca.ET.170.01.1.1]